MRFDAVIKVGGSLEGAPELRGLMEQLAALARRFALLVVPGGASFADAVRQAYRRGRLGEVAAHRMALLAMDQYGLLLADLAPGAVAAPDLVTAGAAARAGQLPVLLPAALTWQLDQVPCSWNATSDAIAAWLAGVAGAPALVLLKDVDGVLEGDPRLSPDAALLPAVPRSALAGWGVVDPEFSRLLPPAARCWIIGGRRLDRVRELLETGRTVGTEVTA